MNDASEVVWTIRNHHSGSDLISELAYMTLVSQVRFGHGLSFEYLIKELPLVTNGIP